MSAFLVSRAHIDTLVAAAVSGPAATTGTWYPPQWPAVAWTAVDALDWRAAAECFVTAEYDNADRVGSMLWAENLASVAHRYPNDVDGTRPSGEDFADTDTITYQWPMSTPRPDAVAALKALDCYEYQSCEHPGWRDSEAYRFCDALRRALVAHVPGYRDAAWAITAGTRV